MTLQEPTSLVGLAYAAGQVRELLSQAPAPLDDKHATGLPA